LQKNIYYKAQAIHTKHLS